MTSLGVPEIEAGWALFLDLDGTLLDIAPTPDAVLVPPGLTDTLAGLRRRLAGIPGKESVGEAAAHENRELFASGRPIHPNTSIKSNLLTEPPAHPTGRVVKSPHFSTLAPGEAACRVPSCCATG